MGIPEFCKGRESEDVGTEVPKWGLGAKSR